MAFFEHSKNGITPLYQFSEEIIIGSSKLSEKKNNVIFET